MSSLCPPQFVTVTLSFTVNSGQFSVRQPTEKKKVKQKVMVAGAEASIEDGTHRSLRQSTIETSQERVKNWKALEKKRKKPQYKSVSKSRLTQEQLLAEARQTELENLASLDAYTKLEAEKKTFKQKRRVLEGPIIRYCSVSMPDVSVVDGAHTGGESVTMESRCTRNFVTFTDTNSFPDQYFPRRRPVRPKRLYCPVTGLPAKYMDPLTNTPYATSHAFRILRNQFVKEGEERCEKRLLQLSSWLKEKKRLKLECS